MYFLLSNGTRVCVTAEFCFCCSAVVVATSPVRAAVGDVSIVPVPPAVRVAVVVEFAVAFFIMFIFTGLQESLCALWLIYRVVDGNLDLTTSGGKFTF